MSQAVERLLLEVKVTYHLIDNHYPPVPRVFIPAAMEAIERTKKGSDLRIRLPKGMLYKGKHLVFPSDIIEEFRLELFIESEEE